MLRATGSVVGFEVVPGDSARPLGLRALFQIETRVFGVGSGAVRTDQIRTRSAGFGDALGGDLVVDLAAQPSRRDGKRAAGRVRWLGLEPGLLAALLAGRTPMVCVVGPQGPVATARPGAERVGLVKAAFEETLARVATLIEAALDGAATAVPPALPGELARD